jgi:hypothetical protein
MWRDVCVVDMCSQLARCVGAALVPHVGDLCGQISKKALDGRLKGPVWTALQTIEESAGPESYPHIKKKVPTYTSVRI